MHQTLNQINAFPILKKWDSIEKSLKITKTIIESFIKLIVIHLPVFHFFINPGHWQPPPDICGGRGKIEIFLWYHALEISPKINSSPDFAEKSSAFISSEFYVTLVSLGGLREKKTDIVTAFLRCSFRTQNLRGTWYYFFSRSDETDCSASSAE